MAKKKTTETHSATRVVKSGSPTPKHNPPTEHPWPPPQRSWVQDHQVPGSKGK